MCSIRVSSVAPSGLSNLPEIHMSKRRNPTRILLCAVNVCTFQRVQSPPGNSRLPRSNRSGGGGNESAEAFGVKGHSYGDSATMQAVTQVNARRGLEKSNVDADTAVGWGRPARQGKAAINAPCRSTGVESSSMYRRNVQKARDTDGDGGRHATNGQPVRARSGRQRRRRGPYER